MSDVPERVEHRALAVPDRGRGGPGTVADALTNREWSELVDVVVRRIEQRVIDDLERRGRRDIPGVF